ncbi:MAG: hypothetical protein GY835_17720 [bacterium]|nr:hypothetical protein [bacterium]
MAILAAILFFRMGCAVLPIMMCVAASLLDFVDGWLARKTGQITKLGEHLDPLADKVLTSVTFLALAFFVHSIWITIMVVVLLVREWGMTWLREYFQNRNKITLPASRLGKWKMLAQSLFGNLFLFLLYLQPEGRPLYSTYIPMLYAAMVLILLLSYISAFRYIFRLRKAARIVA